MNVVQCLETDSISASGIQPGSVAAHFETGILGVYFEKYHCCGLGVVYPQKVDVLEAWFPMWWY